MHRCHCFGTKGHGANRLNTPKHINFMGAAQMHCSNNRRVRGAIKGRGCRHNSRHASHRCGCHRHMRGGHHRKFTPRHITAYRLNRNILMPQHHTGQRFNLYIAHAVTLNLSEISDLLLGEFYIFHIALRDLCHQRFDIGLGQAKGSRTIRIKFFRQTPNRYIAFCFNRGKDCFNILSNLRIIFGAR